MTRELDPVWYGRIRIFWDFELGFLFIYCTKSDAQKHIEQCRNRWICWLKSLMVAKRLLSITWWLWLSRSSNSLWLDCYTFGTDILQLLADDRHCSLQLFISRLLCKTWYAASIALLDARNSRSPNNWLLKKRWPSWSIRNITMSCKIIFLMFLSNWQKTWAEIEFSQTSPACTTDSNLSTFGNTFLCRLSSRETLTPGIQIWPFCPGKPLMILIDVRRRELR